MVLVFVVHRYKKYAKLTKQSYRELHIIGQISKCFWQKHVEISKCYALNVPQKHKNVFRTTFALKITKGKEQKLPKFSKNS